MADKIANRTLNLRLLRKGRPIEKAFNENFSPKGKRALNRHQWTGGEGGSLFIGQIYTNAPNWRPFLLAGSPDIPDDMQTGGAGAVIFLPIADRVIAVCFGHAHIALNDDAFERQFGLKVTLNAVPRSQLRTMDLATPDANTFQRRVQSSKDADLEEFGVDMLRDLARVAGGTPKDSNFAMFAAGKDSLSITCKVSAKDIHKKCAEVLQVFHATTYKADYSWVANMKPVLEKDILKKLDKRLQSNIRKLGKGKSSDLYMAPPEIVNYIEGTELHYNGFGSHGTEFHSLSISDYVDELNRCKFKGKIAEIKKNHRVYAMSEGGKFTERWRIYDCFVFETKLTIDSKKGFYILFAGDWFQVEKKFKARIDKAFDNLKKVTLVGPTKCKNEEELIDDLEKNRTDLLKLDRVMVRPEGEGRLAIEACDFFSKGRCFIHLKDGGSSGAISHLWSQGVVSAEMFAGDKVFRKDLRAKVKTLGPGFETELPKANIIPDRQTYTIVYGIMRRPNKKSKKLDLPFFSKVSLQVATTRLATLGLPVAIELIAKP